MQDLTQPASPESPSINPFRDDVYSPQSAIPGTPQIHQDEMTYCVQAIEKMVALSDSSSKNHSHGELISLSSPLAGYGKSHLIGRISKTMPESVSLIELSFGSRFSWRSLLSSTLQNVDSKGGSSCSEMTSLDETAAFFLSNLIRSALSQGVIEEKECPVSLEALENNFESIFSGGGKSKFFVWMKKKCPLLKTSVSLFNSSLEKFSKDDTAFWTDYFLSHFRQEDTGTSFLKDLSETETRDRLLQLLAITSANHPLLIVIDHLDGCHGSATAGMEVATALTSIVEKVSHCVLIISINGDLWDSVFRDRLPSALVDRLDGEKLELATVEQDLAKELIINRLCSSGFNYHMSHQFADAVAEDCGWTEDSKLYPRKVIREAKGVWKKRKDEFQQPEEPESTPVRESVSLERDFPGLGINQPETQDHPLPYTEPKTSPLSPHSNPFEGHSMAYSDRPLPMDSVSKSDLAAQNRQPYGEISPQSPPDDLQTGRMDAEPLPLRGYPQTQPAAQYKDEPSVRPSAGASTVDGVNAKTNGHSVDGINLNGVKIEIPIENTQSASPLEIYFSQLEAHFSNKGLLDIEFPTFEGFIKTVGNKHEPLAQDELSIAGGQGSCLRWVLSNYMVWIGFEPSRNIFYYSNVLQKLLSDPSGKPGKIVCFSHASSPFNRELLTNNGITDTILKQYFDIIHLSDAELVLINAAARFVKETVDKGYEEEGIKFIIKKLNPLWQRLCQPLGSSAK